MKIPEPLFAIINPVMKTLLRSPLHFIFSGSIMLIGFRGLKTGRQYSTPVRYMREGEVIRCSTEKKNLWWRNLAKGAEITLRIKGQDLRFRAIPIVEDPEKTVAYLERFLQAFPEDAAYMDVHLDANKIPVQADLLNAAAKTVLIEAVPVRESEQGT